MNSANGFAQINYSQPIYLTALQVRSPAGGIFFDASFMQGGYDSVGNIPLFPVESFQFSSLSPGGRANINYNGFTDPSTDAMAAVLLATVFYQWNKPIRMDWMKVNPLSGTTIQMMIWYTLKP